MATAQKLNFDEMFIVKEINAEGKKFAMTDRLICKSESDAIELLIDVHSELFKIEIGTKFRVVIVNTFREDGLPDDDEYDPNMSNRMLNRFEYAMCGQVYRIEGGGSNSKNGTAAVFASYGGLLMRIKAHAEVLTGFEDDQTLYFMAKKLNA